MSKLSDKIRSKQEDVLLQLENSPSESEEEGKLFYSFEYFPPKTEVGLKNLYEVLKKMVKINPLWIDVTWGAGGSTADATFSICEDIVKKFDADVMMHLTCTNMEVAIIDEVLQNCQKAGIRNILALRGDPPAGQAWKQVEGGFSQAADLVAYIRRGYGDYFCIGAKVAAGADLVVTQLFYSTDLFVDYSYAGFKRMTDLCKTFVPEYITTALEDIKDDAEKVKAFGVQLAVDMCKAINKECGPHKERENGVFGLHFYTLNSDVSTLDILKRLGMVEEGDLAAEEEKISTPLTPLVTVFNNIA
eukprot:gene29173-38237_t